MTYQPSFRSWCDSTTPSRANSYWEQALPSWGSLAKRMWLPDTFAYVQWHWRCWCSWWLEFMRDIPLPIIRNCSRESKITTAKLSTSSRDCFRNESTTALAMWIWRHILPRAPWTSCHQFGHCTTLPTSIFRWAPSRRYSIGISSEDTSWGSKSSISIVAQTFSAPKLCTTSMSYSFCCESSPTSLNERSQCTTPSVLLLLDHL